MAVIRFELTQDPEFHHTKAELAVCSIQYKGLRHVAFDDAAVDLYAHASLGDKVELHGYYKTSHWVDRNGVGQSREDFIIKRWERII